MNFDQILGVVRDYVARDLLAGEDAGLDGQTPLLEYGLIDSVSLVRLTEFLHSRFGVKIPRDELTIANLKDLHSITTLVVRLERAR